MKSQNNPLDCQSDNPGDSREDTVYEVVPVQEGYDRWADIYDTEDTPLTTLETAHVTKPLGDVRDLRVADIGCVTGRLDVTNGLPVASRTFDRVTCCLVLEHIAGLNETLSEMARICHINGLAVISVLHPAIRLRNIQAQFNDPSTGHKIRPASVDHQISDYVMATTRAGFRIDHMSEHVVDEELAGRSPRARKLLGWPLLLLMRFHNVAQDEHPGL